jgi:hypothetical protein
MNNRNQQNEYLKSLVKPIEILQRTISNSKRNINFEYFINLSNKSNPSIKTLNKVCKIAFLKLHQIKDSRLRRKIQTNRNETEIKTGKHDSRPNKIPLEVEMDIREFIENYPSRESHYSESVKTGRKYLGSDKNIRILYDEFIQEYVEYQNYVKYGFFRYIFRDCNVGFGFPRADICGFCDELDVKIKSAKVSENLLEIESLNNIMKEHHNQANYFYTLQNKIKELSKENNDISVLSVDYQKNFYLPITKVSIEYFCRQLSLHNFCIHEMVSKKATMFMYSENFAAKGPNETISFVDYYIKKNIPISTKKLYVFSDNQFAQNKSRFIWLFYYSLVLSNRFECVELIYPIPGNSYLDCDRDFGLIEKLKLKIEKISVPSEWMKLVKSANFENPFDIVHVNHSLTDNLISDGSPIVKVLDFKSLMENHLKQSLEHLTQVRRIKFSRSEIKISLDLRIEPDIELKLLKTDENSLDINNFFNDIKLAYSDFLPIRKEKLDNIKKLLTYVSIPQEITFYDSLKSIENNAVLKYINRENTSINSSQLCNCKSYCIRKCVCRQFGLKCNTLCACSLDKCKNRII